MILIVGSTGTLGSRVARQLLADGQRVRAMTRTPEKAADLKQLGAEVIQGDLVNAASLNRACQGADRVFVAAHSILGNGKYKSEYVDDVGHCALIDAAKRAGVSHFVYTSVYGTSPDSPVDFFRTKYKVEQYLKGSGLNFTILRPTAFMEDHAHNFNGKSILEKGKTSLLGNDTKPRNFVAARDVSKFAIMALTDSKLKNRTLEIGGPQNFTNNEVAELYGKLAGITPRVSHMPPSVARAMSVILKSFQPGISRIMYINSLPDDAFPEAFDPTRMLQQFPMQLTALQEFIRERIAERNGAAK
ncbi:MAG: NAD-dependent epimerase/dehydratase family protein [Chloroflexota bacterium]|nr:MAG: NAD-dependent epimerase/dehydratase family protein [Chloroflexota bacterium]